MSLRKNISTQCNFYLLEDKPSKRNRFTQTLPLSERKANSKASKPTTRSASTQCCMEIGTSILKRNVATQVQKQKRDQGCQTERPSLETFNNKIQEFVFIIEEDHSFSCLSYKVTKSSRGETCLVIFNNSHIGLLGEDVEPVKVVLAESGKCTIIVPFQPIEVLNLVLNNVILKEEYLEVLNRVSGTSYALCPSIKCMTSDTSMLPKGIKCLKIPFQRYQSDACVVWYKTSSASNSNQKILQCTMCRKAAASFRISCKRKRNVSPNQKAKRQNIDSKFNYCKLTPRSRKIRLKRLKQARICLKKKVQRLEKLIEHKDLLLEDNQSRQMESIVKILNENHKEDLETIFQEHSSKDKNILKEIWSRDSYSKHCSDIKDFYEDQMHCRNGSKGNRWSSITLRIALAIYCRSPAAYEALKSFQILQLPSVESVQNSGRKFISEPGINHIYLAEQKENYCALRDEKVRLGEVYPKGEGVLIFDEVKVIEKVIWNSKNHKFIGFSMNFDEYPLLNDICTPVDSLPKPTQYVLQFLWRDMTSEFDLIGPYFTFSESVESQPLLGSILETMKALEAYSFHTIALVCDGASENLATLKLTMDLKGAFPQEMQPVTPVFENPFREKGHSIHWIICPSHQMKNMISAIHSSKPSGARLFKRNDVIFGWSDIEELKRRENIRVQKGQMRYVPKLLDSYVIRDSWTRLNVKPSKIMQQENVLSELYSFSTSNEGTVLSRQSAFECYKYLKACNCIFECGLLSSGRVKTEDSPILQSVSQGFGYFSNWNTEVQEKLKSMPTTSQLTRKYKKQGSKIVMVQEKKSEVHLIDTVMEKAVLKKQFLSWQTWDLLRVCVFGFQGFCLDFLSRNPEHYICPIRINGSALESLFSQFKYSTGCKLSGTNYSVARKAVLIKRNIHGRNSSNKDYRDVPLYIRESRL